MRVKIHSEEAPKIIHLGLVVLCGHQVTLLGRLWQPLAWGALLSSGLGLLLLHLVGMHSEQATNEPQAKDNCELVLPVQEVLPALAVLHVLHTHTDPLGQDLATNTLVDNNTDGALGNVEHTSGLAVVGLVGHTLLESTTS